LREFSKCSLGCVESGFQNITILGNSF